MIKEFECSTLPGMGMLALILGIAGSCLYAIVQARHMEEGRMILLASVFLLIFDLLLLPGLFILGPNRAAVLTLFGKYKGTVKKAGLHWTNPLMGKDKVSLRVRNFETTHLKVNDHDGNPE